ncbi:MAG: sigma 54-interacting transcriptional regulator [Gracilibacteraceae bacterium]|nr:sigma 54-interacting transcriptional regulator [Gracilibacteraceae bacterium]
MSKTIERRYYKDILDSINDGILVVDMDMVVVYVNPAYLALSQMSEEHFIGKKLDELLENPLLPGVIESGAPLNGMRYKERGGKETYISMSPLKVDGKIRGGVTIFKETDSIRKQLREYQSRLNQIRNHLQGQHRAEAVFQDIIGSSPLITQTVNMAKKVAVKNIGVLLLGESGVGKDMFAQAIHNASIRSGRPFVCLNCAALPANLVESELFGYESGAFSGAAKDGKIGLFQIADTGTLFLDEIGDLELGLQAKLLRVLETGQFLRIGGVKPVSVNARCIGATHRDLEAMLKEGTFREDLYYRLCVASIEIPPLRDHPEDIEPLAKHFLKTQQLDERERSFAPEVLRFFRSYAWPGNIRELRNTILAMLSFADSDILKTEHLPQRLQRPPQGQSRPPAAAPTAAAASDGLNQKVRDIEARIIRDKLAAYGNSLQAKKRIAEELGFSLATLYNKIKRYGLRQGKENSHK